ncbi:DUF3515 family protein [Microbacterium sp. ET2]|uniref:DUF3515 family protein n=1 Tax=Microbacterium albipurpureum TaxID=3050384 RepID=UPI00259CE0DD|nr:DUF3515 family protein [Microbacterium sp. ET2 (Ac-2212)]WJL95793.1 DUF3515 family protein [Microbacterium sp. ET2 (Ac-2212)]
MRSPRRRLPFLALAVGAALTLTACTATVSVPAADGADDPLCAEVTVRLPDAVDGQERRWTDAQATGAWGTPASVILTCGVEPPGPTEARCITIGGVDWIVDESDPPRYLIRSYGRTPAVEVYADNSVVSPNEVLSALGPIVSQLPRDAECTSTETLLD